ncbi:nucleoporin-domain-containing protein [Hesseltinella vesiculosa]|uniref:Nucleoporin-domain-containing protein n=1 Tax=Hesseltinella vesiculosa TaxID=101127 RepID=A0A1X2GUZ0_9FUNG|nr:nucleoporin-domain-containing protein [Hesseltinella vesiculosa]
MNNTKGSPNHSQDDRLHDDVCKLIDDFMKQDQKEYDLSDYLRVPVSKDYNRPLTGTDGYYTMQGKTIKVPVSIIQSIDHDFFTFQGLLPEIGRAWITSDNRLFLWNYENGTDVYCFDDQDQIISSVALVKPRPGVFSDMVKYILVIATAIEVFVLGVDIHRGPSDPKGGKLIVHATDITASTNGQQITGIWGTDNGRVMMVGKNGHIYELKYANHRSWLHSVRLDCLTSSGLLSVLLPKWQWKDNYKSLAIDNERRALYALRENNNIDLFFLGRDDKTFQPVPHGLKDIEKSARIMSRQPIQGQHPRDFQIQSLHIVPNSESRIIHLVAVTERGYRLYFTHLQNALRKVSNLYPSMAPVTTGKIVMDPNGLELVHVRLPPQPQNVNLASPVNNLPSTSTNHLTSMAPATPATTMSPISQYGSHPISAAYYHCGVLVTAQSSLDNVSSDKVFLAYPVMGKNSTTSDTKTAADGRSNLYAQPVSATTTTYSETLMTLGTQGRVWAIAEDTSTSRLLFDNSGLYSDSPRKLLVFTDSGLTSFTKRRPVDTLYQILLKSRSNKDSSHRDLLGFIDQFGDAQACAISLSIVCSSYGSKSREHGEVALRASHFYFDFGGQPLSTGASLPQNTNYLGLAVGPSGTRFSSKHDGLVLYLSRLIAPIWHTAVLGKVCDASDIDQVLAIQGELLAVRANLKNLKEFLDKNPSMYTPPADHVTQIHDHVRQQAVLDEQKSFKEILKLVTHTVEAISFIDFVIDSKASDVLRCTRPDTRQTLLEMTMETLVAKPQGIQLKRDLIVATINKYASKHMHCNYDVVTKHLREQCPNLFSETDMKYYEGVESLSHAHKAEVEYERMQALEESVRYLMQAADAMSDEGLTEICVDYRYQGFYTGVVDLALARAYKLDPQRKGLAYRLDNSPVGDARQPVHDACVRCYEQIFQCIDEIQQLKQGVKLQRRPDQNQDLSAVLSQTLTKALASNDQLFHYTLYDWYRLRGMKRELLAVDSEFIVPYLKQQVQRKEGWDILWQYHRQRSRFLEAALYLEGLATLFPELTYEKRLEYLGLGIVNARCLGPDQLNNPDATHLLERLELQLEKLRSDLP